MDATIDPTDSSATPTVRGPRTGPHADTADTADTANTANTAADSAGFAGLLQRHRGIVLKIASTYARDAQDREDLAQEIAVQLWRAWPGYDPRRTFTTWMYRVALNVGISHLRGDGRRRAHLVPLDDGLHDAPDPGAADPERDQQLRMLHGFIATLEPLNRALLLLYLEERSTREMAEVLGLSETNVTTRISRLRQRIRDHVAPNA